MRTRHAIYVQQESTGVQRIKPLNARPVQTALNTSTGDLNTSAGQNLMLYVEIALKGKQDWLWNLDISDYAPQGHASPSR